MAMRASRRRGAATKVGQVMGVRRTISAGLRRSPVMVPNWQPASAAMTTPAAISWVASPRKVHGLEPIGGDECLLAAGAAQVAEPAGQGPRIDGPQGIGADADIILVVKHVGVVGDEPMAVEPGPAPLDGPEELPERRDGDHAQDGLSLDDQADADRPERQAVDQVPGAVDRVDRPSTRAAAPSGAVFLAGQAIVGKLCAQPPADQPLQVLVQVGHVAQVRFLVGRDPAAARQGRTGRLGRKALTNSSSADRSGESFMEDILSCGGKSGLRRLERFQRRQSGRVRQEYVAGGVFVGKCPGARLWSTCG